MEQFNRTSTDWKTLYEAALLETGHAKLQERMSAARHAIFDRIEESLRNPLPTEQRAMNDALRQLRNLSEINAPFRAAA